MTDSREESIFVAAMERSSDQDRLDYVEGACAGDQVLLRRVQFLLASHDKSHGALDQPPPGIELTREMSSATEEPGWQIGPYKLREQIGEGGFGVVYLAEQQEPVRRHVALKLLKPGMDSSEVITRFEAERQALAMMDHPGIARVLDGGETESGRPYFVMELVKGIPITDYLDQCNLTTYERLDLFISVCEAVQHAHQKGVIHRDIKPTNVMIAIQDGRPAVKVIDFGVAKATGQRLTERTLLTGFMQMVGTPLYMSPEQAEMGPLDVDTRSDIYSLGVLLYELLTGTTPFDRDRLQSVGYDELRRIIREEEPPRPSSRLSTLQADSASTVAERRRTDPRKLGQIVRGDLDWIVMKALEKDRMRRYSTASDFARDVERFLNQEPIDARPPSTLYRFRKFSRRNRTALATTAIVLVTIVAGLSISTYLITEQRNVAQLAAQQERRAAGEARRHEEDAELQRQVAQVKADEAEKQRKRAEANLSKAREAVDRLFTKAAQDLADKPDVEHIRRALLEDALEFYQGFLEQKSDDADIRLETALAHQRVAQIHGMLGDAPKQVQNLQEQLRILQRLRDDFPKEARYRHLLAKSHRDVGTAMLVSGQHVEGTQRLRTALEQWEALARDYPRRPEYHKEIVAWHIVSRDISSYEKPKEGEARLRKGLTMLDNFEAEFPEFERSDWLRARAHHELGRHLYRQFRFAEAEREARESLRLHKGVGGNYYMLAQIALAQGKPQQSEALIRKSIAGDQARHDRYPDVFQPHLSLSAKLAVLRDALSAMDQWEEAEQTARQMVVIHTKWSSRFPDRRTQRVESAWTTYELGNILFIAGKTQQAADAYRPAFTLFEGLAKEFPDTPRHQNHFAHVLATCPAKQFRDPKRAVAVAKRVLQLSPNNGDYWCELGIAQVVAGEFEAAINSIEEARRQLDGDLPSEAGLVLAMAYLQSGDEQRGRHVYDKTIAEIKNSPSGHWYAIEYRYLRKEADKMFSASEPNSDTNDDN